ncbi:MAG: hypothetical protein ACOVQE_01420 [Chitinophagaceae bacterium]
MFYQQLYAELGKLFYLLAATDGKVQTAEKEALFEQVKTIWLPIESSVDSFKTDAATQIFYAFDFAESEGIGTYSLADFGSFFHQNKQKFNNLIITNILATAEAVAAAFKGQNKSEKAFIDDLDKLLTEA